MEFGRRKKGPTKKKVGASDETGSTILSTPAFMDGAAESGDNEERK